MTAKHTPGPWEVSPDDQMRVNVKTGSYLHPHEPRVATAEDLKTYGDDCHDDWNICQCDDEFFMRNPKECEANARLIAAAPDLLEACEMLLACAGLDQDDIMTRAADLPAYDGAPKWLGTELLQAMFEAIAKAKGQ